MNNNIKKLAAMAAKSERLIIGLMSGTSLDGLDIALCRVVGTGLATQVEVVEFVTVPYSAVFRDDIRAVFSKKMVDLELLCLLNASVGQTHGEMINSQLKQWGRSASEIDLIASHGQTVYHAPKHLHNRLRFGNATLQIGDGDHVACSTGIVTVSDFRQRHIAAGGEGAPLAAYGDYLIFSRLTENRVLLNMGGIANLTVLPASRSLNGVFTSDVGPGNTLMDALVQRDGGQLFDEDARLASAGQVNASLLTALVSDDFFNLKMPKTIGPELFNLQYLQAAQVQSSTSGLSLCDLLATLNQASAISIAEAIKYASNDLDEVHIYASGGGVHNPLLIRNIETELGGNVLKSTQVLGVDPNAKEAVLFALLANEALANPSPISFLQKNGMPKVSMGKICFYE